MAYIKIIPIKVTDKKAIDYITNPAKTDEKILVSSFGCSPETADIEFAFTRELAKKNVMDKGNNLAFHLIQSFKPGETDAQTAHSLGIEFANEILKGKYEYVISTHVDQNHIHNHLIFNATSFIDFHKYVSNKKSYYRICKISNRICHANGLMESLPTGEKGKSYKENMEYQHGTSWKAKIKAAIDKAIWSSITYEEFLQKMKLYGYEIRQGKHLAFRAPDQTNFTNMKTLGSFYSEENVLSRLEKNRTKPQRPQFSSPEIHCFVTISKYITTGNRKGYEKWAQLNNLKEAAKTFNYLSEHNLLNYDNFQNHVADISASLHSVDLKIKNLEKELSHIQQIQKYCSTYRTCRMIVENEINQKDILLYRKQNESTYKLHDITKKKLQALGITKLPRDELLLAQLQKLQRHYNQTLLEKNELHQKLKTVSTIQKNLSALNQSTSLSTYIHQDHSI